MNAALVFTAVISGFCFAVMGIAVAGADYHDICLAIVYAVTLVCLAVNQVLTLRQWSAWPLTP